MGAAYLDYIPALKALSDETRLKIVDMLSCGELCACQILEGLSISQSTLSYHMKILAESGLVNGVRDGAWMRYTLERAKTESLIEFLTEVSTEKEGYICMYNGKKSNSKLNHIYNKGSK